MYDLLNIYMTTASSSQQCALLPLYQNNLIHGTANILRQSYAFTEESCSFFAWVNNTNWELFFSFCSILYIISDQDYVSNSLSLSLSYMIFFISDL